MQALAGTVQEVEAAVEEAGAGAAQVVRLAQVGVAVED